MNETLKNEAEVLAVALEVGAASVGDVVDWADAVIEKQEHPHWSICELATMGSSYEPDVVRALREVPGTADGVWVRSELLRRLEEELTEDASRADRIASALYRLALAYELPEESLHSLAWWAWHALDLADQRMIEETSEEIVAIMVQILREAASMSGR